MAAAHDLRHATNTEPRLHIGSPLTQSDASLNYPSNFPSYDSWHPIDWVWAPSGYAYRLPFQTILEQRWGAVGVDPRKVNNIARRALGAVDVETDLSVTPHSIIRPTADVHPHTNRQASITSSSSRSSSYDGQVNNDHAANPRSVHTRTITPLPRRSSGILPASARVSEHILTRPSPKPTQPPMSYSSRSSSPESSLLSDDDYTETLSGTINRTIGAGSEKSRSAGETIGLVLKDAAPATTSRATPSSGSCRRYPCPHEGCPQVCDRPHDLERHLESKAHKAPSYKCLACSQLFTRQDPLKRHRDGRCPVMRAEQQARAKAKRQRTK